MGDVIKQTAHHCLPGRDEQGLAAQQPGHIHPRHQSPHCAAHVPFRAGDLPGEEEVRPLPVLQSRVEQCRAVDECVAVHLAQAHKLCVGQTGDHLQNLRLLPPFHIRLEPYHIVKRARHIVLAQLDHRIGPPSGARVAQADGAHRAKGQGIHPAGSQHFDGHTALEVALQLRVGALQFRLGRGQQRGDKSFVLGFVQGTVDIIPLLRAIHRAFVPAALAKGDGHIHTLRRHNRGHRVVKVEIAPGQLLHIRGQVRAGQGAGGEDCRPVGDGGHLFPAQVDARVAADPFGDLRGEFIPPYGQGAARRQGVFECRTQNQTAQRLHLIFQNAQRPVGQSAAHRIAAHQLGQTVGDVGRGGAHRAHFIEGDGEAPLGQLPGRFGSGQPATHNCHSLSHYVSFLSAAGERPAGIAAQRQTLLKSVWGPLSNRRRWTADRRPPTAPAIRQFAS